MDNAKQLLAKIKHAKLIDAFLAWKRLAEFEVSVEEVAAVVGPHTSTLSRHPSHRSSQELSHLCSLLTKVRAYSNLPAPVLQFIATYARLQLHWETTELPAAPEDGSCLYSIVSGNLHCVVGDLADPGLKATLKAAADQLLDLPEAEDDDWAEDCFTSTNSPQPSNGGALPAPGQATAAQQQPALPGTSAAQCPHSDGSDAPMPQEMKRYRDYVRLLQLYGLSDKYALKLVSSRLWHTVVQMIHSGRNKQDAETTSGAQQRQKDGHPPSTSTTAADPTDVSSSTDQPAPAAGSAAALTVLDLQAGDSFTGHGLDARSESGQSETHTEFPPRIIAAITSPHRMTALLVISRAVYRKAMALTMQVNINQAVASCCRLACLRHTPLTALHRLGKHLTMTTYKKGDVLLQQGKEAYNVYLLLNGEVDIVVDIPIITDRQASAATAVLSTSASTVASSAAAALSALVPASSGTANTDAATGAICGSSGTLPRQKSTAFHASSTDADPGAGVASNCLDGRRSALSSPGAVPRLSRKSLRVATKQRVLLAKRAQGCVLGDDALRDKIMGVSVIVSSSTATCLLTSVSRFTMCMDPLTVRLFQKLRNQTGMDVLTDVSLLSTENREKFLQRCRDEILIRAWDDSAAALPSTLHKDGAGEAGGDDGVVETAEKPAWRLTSKSACDKDPADHASKIKASKILSPEVMQYVPLGHDAAWKQPLPDLPKGISSQWLKNVHVTESISGLKRMISDLETARAQAGNPAKIVKSRNSSGRLAGRLATADVIDAREGAAIAAHTKEKAEKVEAACVVAVHITALPGQGSVAGLEDDVSSVMDDALNAWSQLAHKAQVQLIRWNAFEHYVVANITHTRPVPRLVADMVLGMLSTFNRLVDSNPMHHHVLHAGFAIGGCFITSEFNHVTSLSGSAFDAAHILCSAAQTSSPLHGSILVSDAVMSSISRSHDLTFASQGYVLVSTRHLPATIDLDVLYGSTTRPDIMLNRTATHDADGPNGAAKYVVQSTARAAQFTGGIGGIELSDGLPGVMNGATSDCFAVPDLHASPHTGRGLRTGSGGTSQQECTSPLRRSLSPVRLCNGTLGRTRSPRGETCTRKSVETPPTWSSRNAQRIKLQPLSTPSSLRSATDRHSASNNGSPRAVHGASPHAQHGGPNKARSPQVSPRPGSLASPRKRFDADSALSSQALRIRDKLISTSVMDVRQKLKAELRALGGDFPASSDLSHIPHSSFSSKRDSSSTAVHHDNDDANNNRPANRSSSHRSGIDGIKLGSGGAFITAMPDDGIDGRSSSGNTSPDQTPRSRSSSPDTVARAAGFDGSATASAVQDIGTVAAAREFANGMPTSLPHISFSACGLTRLPALDRLTQLECVSASFNPLLPRLPRSWFKTLGSQIKVLNLSHSIMERLPSDFGTALPTLTELNVSCCKLTQLPESIAAIPRLRCLSVEHNQLTQLPDSFWRLYFLEQCHLGHNRLRLLPDCWHAFPALQLLQVKGNRLRSLPSSIVWLGSSLVNLDVSMNAITSLPSGFLASMTALRSLNLSYNKLCNCKQIHGPHARLSAFESSKAHVASISMPTGSRSAALSIAVARAASFARSSLASQRSFVSKSRPGSGHPRASSPVYSPSIAFGGAGGSLSRPGTATATHTPFAALYENEAVGRSHSSRSAGGAFGTAVANMYTGEGGGAHDRVRSPDTAAASRACLLSGGSVGFSDDAMMTGMHLVGRKSGRQRSPLAVTIREREDEEEDACLPRTTTPQAQAHVSPHVHSHGEERKQRIRSADAPRAQSPLSKCTSGKKLRDAAGAPFTAATAEGGSRSVTPGSGGGVTGVDFVSVPVKNTTATLASPSMSPSAPGHHQHGHGHGPQRSQASFILYPPTSPGLGHHYQLLHKRSHVNTPQTPQTVSVLGDGESIQLQDPYHHHSNSPNAHHHALGEERGHFDNVDLMQDLDDLSPLPFMLDDQDSDDSMEDDFDFVGPYLPKLLQLDLAANQLVAVPAWLPSTITDLNLSKNKITVLPEWLPDRMQRLQLLSLHGNQLESLPRDVSSLKSLKMLSLEDNPATDPETVMPGSDTDMSWAWQGIRDAKYENKKLNTLGASTVPTLGAVEEAAGGIAESEGSHIPGGVSMHSVKGES